MRRSNALALALLAALALVAVAPAQTGYSAIYDSGSHRVYPVVTTRLGGLTDLFGRRGFDADVLAIAGTDDVGSPVGGLALAPSFQVARGVALQLGPWAKFQAGHKLAGGIFIGFSGSF